MTADGPIAPCTPDLDAEGKQFDHVLDPGMAMTGGSWILLVNLPPAVSKCAVPTAWVRRRYY